MSTSTSWQTYRVTGGGFGTGSVYITNIVINGGGLETTDWLNPGSSGLASGWIIVNYET